MTPSTSARHDLVLVRGSGVAASDFPHWDHGDPESLDLTDVERRMILGDKGRRP